MHPCSPPSASTRATSAASTATSGSGSACAPSAPPSRPPSSASPTPTTSPAPGTALVKVDASPPVPFTAAPSPPARPTRDGAGPAIHQVWLPPLAGDVALDPLLGTAAPGWLQVPVGVVDRPLDQVQEPLVLDLSGPPGTWRWSGRPGPARARCWHAGGRAGRHPPARRGPGLRRRPRRRGPPAGRPAPRRGRLRPREAERVQHLVRELRSLVLERERRFRDLGVDSMASWHELRRAGLDLGGYGEVVLVIDNWGAFVRELPELEAEITGLAAVGLHYGVHLVLAANRWAELRPGLRENLGGRLELRLNDPWSPSSAGRPRPSCPTCRAAA